MTTKSITAELKAYFKEMGTKGGKVTSKAKAKSSRENVAKATAARLRNRKFLDNPNR